MGDSGNLSVNNDTWHQLVTAACAKQAAVHFHAPHGQHMDPSGGVTASKRLLIVKSSLRTLLRHGRIFRIRALVPGGRARHCQAWLWELNWLG